MSNIADDFKSWIGYSINVKDCREALREKSRGAFFIGKGARHEPYKPKTPYSWSGYPKFTEGRFCTEHQKLYDKQYETYDRDRNAKRKYGRAWKRIRDRYIHTHPLCEECLKEHRYTKATEVHHRLPLSHGGTHHVANLEVLCHECHSRITAEMGDRWHKRKKYKSGDR